MISQRRSFRKSTGGKYRKDRKKKLYEAGRMSTLTKVSDKILKKVVRIIGGNTKAKLFSVNIINVYNPKTKSHAKVKIKKVIENSANGNFVKRNIFNKGAILDTDIGSVKVTSRPGQNGSLSGIIIDK